ncbi:MAG: aldehyde dehydrogenase [Bacteroidetes bacterium]|nr:aldehyde dehydrogenase [Bacteroidota bacterium]
MEASEIQSLIKNQRKFFLSQETKNIDFRINNLKKLLKTVQAYENRICKALYLDMHKPEFEAYTEVGLVIQELKLHIRKLKKWAKPKRVRTPLVHFLSKSYYYPEPYGRVLIFSPWNYPFQLLMIPLIGAISAGNCALLKASRRAPHTADVINEITSSNFDPGYIAFIKGGNEINRVLLESKFDYIFFTGSVRVGKRIMEAASKNLTPVSLELGGKNPCIVCKDADIDMAAKRITWSKFYNAGQTCVAPDYLLVQKDIKEKLLNKIKFFIAEFYGKKPSESPDYARIINAANVERLERLMRSGNIISGGNTNISENYVAPTLIDNVNPGDLIMQEEIFGPILPVIEYNNIDEIFPLINNNPKPLSLYIFSKSRKLQKYILSRTSSGNGAINDAVIQFSNPYLPYGGVGESGMGRYHGKSTFDTFSNYRAIMKKSNLLDISLRYPPYTKRKTKILKKFLG